MFGNFSPQPFSNTPNGFLALATFDNALSGGTGDGIIDQRDWIFSSLRLWQDLNHNGVSEPGELRGLNESNIKAISVLFKESFRRDRWGNTFRYRGKIYGTENVQRWAYDVLLLH